MTELVNSVTPQVARMRETWDVTEPLMGGTKAMRAAGERLLPRWPNEETEAYKTRKSVATLFPAYQRTIGVMAGKPFSKAITYGDASDAVVKEWQPWLDDIDRQGVSLHVFAAGMFIEALAHGLAGIYVDVPRTDDVVRTASGATTRASERMAGLRPYFVRVKHRQILGWQLADDGSLAQLRFVEKVTVPQGNYGNQVVERVRVLKPGSWELWEDRDGKFVQVDSGVTNLGAIPFVPIYGRRTAFMMGEPPLMDLAYLNIKHWQSQSDQDTILHVARVPILAMTGADESTQLTVGGACAVKLPQGATLEFVEHTGAAISAGATSLTALEDQMIQTGAELLVKQSSQRTATEAVNDQEANRSELQRIAEDFEDSLDQALDFAGQYVGMEAPRVTLFKDYGATLTDASESVLLQACTAGKISDETFYLELQRRGTISPDRSYPQEREALDTQGPALGDLGNAGG